MRKSLILLFFILFLSLQNIVFSAESVGIIYIHGFSAFNTEETLRDARVVSEAFSGRKMGKYCFNGQYKTVLWADLYACEECYKLYRSGLLSINEAHNCTKRKSTVKVDGKLLNPLLPALSPCDCGSGNYTVFFRNLINDFLFQIFYMKDSAKRQELVMDRIQKTADELGGKYVIVAHSFGAVGAVDFVERRVMNNPKNSENFVGIITSADVNSTFNACHWADVLKEENNFVKYMIENGKFWICYNHRNDVVATNLPEQVLNYKANGDGFIVSETTRSNFIRRVNPFSGDNGKVRPHLWMLWQPEDFAKKVVAVYEKNTTK